MSDSAASKVCAGGRDHHTRPLSRDVAAVSDLGETRSNWERFLSSVTRWAARCSRVYRIVHRGVDRFHARLSRCRKI